MPGVGDQLLLPAAGAGQRGQHGVEAGGEPGQLVLTGHRDGLQPVGLRDVLGGSGQPGHRPQPRARHRDPGADRHRDPDAAHHQQYQAELPERPPGLFQGLRQDQCLAGPGRHGHDTVDHPVRTDRRAHRPRRVPAGHLQLRHGQRGGADPALRGHRPAGRVHNGDPDVGRSQRLGRDVRQHRRVGDRRGVCGAAHQVVVEVGVHLVPDGEVRGERGQRHREPHRDAHQPADTGPQAHPSPGREEQCGHRDMLTAGFRAACSRRRARCGSAGARRPPRSCGAGSRRRPRGSSPWWGSRSPTRPRGSGRG